MHKLITRILLLSALLFSVSAFSAEAPVLELSKSFDKANIGGKYTWYEDKTAQLNLNDILSKEYSERFVINQKENLSFGYTSSSIWLQIKIKNLSNDKQNWLLNFDYPLLDKIEIFSKIKGKDWKKEVMGDLLPFHDRPISHRTFVTPLVFNKNETTTYFIRFTSQSSLIIRPLVQTENQFFEHENTLQLIFGIAYGFMLMMALYNIFLYLGVRDTTYLIYVVSVLAGGTFISALNGHAYQFLWPNSPGIANNAIVLSVSVWLVATALFTQKFIETKRYTPALHQLINIMIGLGVFAFFLVFFTDYRFSIRVATALAPLMGVLILVTGTLSWYRGNRAARFFTLAWVVYGFGTAVLVLSRFALIEDNAVTHYSATLGLLFEIIMLSLALSDKYRIISIQLKDHTRKLEQTVTERTQDLTIANKALEQLSHQDALTGLANRRKFDQVLNNEWQRHQRAQTPLSFLLCDIDKFKELNDYFGHEKGDESLKKIAKAIEMSLYRTTDHPSRIGGDEFAIILPDTDSSGAMELAEKIRQNVRKLEIKHKQESGLENVTVSIGAATIVPATDQQSMMLFRNADKALFKAKQQGRNSAASFEAGD